MASAAHRLRITALELKYYFKFTNATACIWRKFTFKTYILR
jgi:hypothetical protein